MLSSDLDFELSCTARRVFEGRKPPPGALAADSVNLEDDFGAVIRISMELEREEGPDYNTIGGLNKISSWGYYGETAVSVTVAGASDPVWDDFIHTQPIFPFTVDVSFLVVVYYGGGGAEDVLEQAGIDGLYTAVGEAAVCS